MCSTVVWAASKKNFSIMAKDMKFVLPSHPKHQYDQGMVF